MNSCSNYEKLMHEVDRYSIDLDKIIYLFEKVTGLKAYKSIDAGVNCKNAEIIELMKDIGLQRTFICNIDDESILCILPDSTENILGISKDSVPDNMKALGIDTFWGTLPKSVYQRVLEKSEKITILRLSWGIVELIYKDLNIPFKDYSVLDMFSSMYNFIKTNTADFKLSTSMITCKDDLVTLAIGGKEKLRAIKIKSRNIYETDEGNKKYTEIVNNIIDKVDTEILMKICAILSLTCSYSERDLAMNYWWLMLNFTVNDVASIKLHIPGFNTYIDEVTTFKELPKLLILDYIHAENKSRECLENEFVEKLGSYCSLISLFSRKEYTYKGLYFDGNLSKERALKKFIKAVKELNLSLSDFSLSNTNRYNMITCK